MTGLASDKQAESRMDALLRLIDDLPTVPETLVRIWQIVDDPLSTSESLAAVVRLDVPLSVKVLRLANSPFYSVGSQSVGDVSAAISMLGFETIKHLAICVSVATSLVRDHGPRGGPLYRALWRHSVVAGVVARRLAKLTGDRNCEEIFTAGLLHDLGKFAILTAYAAPYGEILAARRASGRQLVELETERLGFDHALAGAEFGRSWHFPDVLTEGARGHHARFNGAAGDERIDRVRLTVALADRVAHRLDPPAVDLGYDPKTAETGPLLLRLGLAPRAIEEQAARLRDDLAAARAYMEIV